MKCALIPPVGNFIIPGLCNQRQELVTLLFYTILKLIFGGRSSSNIALNDVMYFDLKETCDARANMTEWLALRLNSTILEPGPRSNIPLLDMIMLYKNIMEKCIFWGCQQ